MGIINKRKEKPKKTAEELVMLLESKGVAFDCMEKEEAIFYLKNKNYYLRTACYKKNFEIMMNDESVRYSKFDFGH